ncbi:MAG: hypothetical protein WAM71_14795 [Candidatus Korobacteraceae bacterium]
MKRRFGLCLLLLVMGVVLGAWGQDEAPPPAQAPAPAPDSSQEPTQSTGPKQEYTEVDPGKSLDFLGEAVNHSTLNLGMTVLAAYDSNIATFGSQRLSQNSYNIAPHIGISQYRPKLALNLSYDGGLGIYQQLPNANSYSQAATADILYQFSSHLQGHLNDTYSYSADPFGSYYTVVGQPTPNQPNANVFVPFATTQQNFGTGNVSYQLSQYDSLTFTGTESFRRYANYTNVYSFQGSLYNLVSYSGGANYSHRVSAQLSFGGGYNFTSLDFSHGQQRSGIEALQGFVNYQYSKSLSISGWAGPEYITAKTGLAYLGQYYILYQNDWVPAFGLNIGWQGLRQSFFLGASRQVSDGGGLLATTTVYNANGAYRRKLTAKWDGVLSMQYSNNASFAASNLNRQLFPNRTYTILQTTAQLSRQITPQVTANLWYAYIRETQKDIYPQSYPTYFDNRVWISIQYSWNHPLGR